MPPAVSPLAPRDLPPELAGSLAAQPAVIERPQRGETHGREPDGIVAPNARRHLPGTLAAQCPHCHRELSVQAELGLALVAPLQRRQAQADRVGGETIRGLDAAGPPAATARSIAIRGSPAARTSWARTPSLWATDDEHRAHDLLQGETMRSAGHWASCTPTCLKTVMPASAPSSPRTAHASGLTGAPSSATERRLPFVCHEPACPSTPLLPPSLTFTFACPAWAPTHACLVSTCSGPKCWAPRR